MNESLPGRIFISYRRQETAWPARQLHDVLVENFTAEQVFKDVDSIEPGEDFVERTTAAVASCDVLLALIGPQWVTMTDKDGHRRLDDPEDYVRLEIETALTGKIRVIPILVDHATMPSADQLPATLAPLVRRNAVEINPETFDTKRLIAAVQKTLAEEQARQRTEAETRQQTQDQTPQQREAEAQREAEEQTRRQAGDRNRRQAGRPLHALLWWWVLLVGLVAAVIGYALRGRSAEGMPNGVQLWGILLVVVVIVPPALVWVCCIAIGQLRGHRRGGRWRRPPRGWPSRRWSPGRGRWCSVGSSPRRRCGCGGDGQPRMSRCRVRVGGGAVVADRSGTAAV